MRDRLDEPFFESLAGHLPRVKGVDWKTCAYASAQNHRKATVRVVAEFEVDMREIDARNIFDKLHEITSSGQVRLELEKYPNPEAKDSDE